MASDPKNIDIPTLIRIAWDLYHSCHLISGDAPDGFRQLVNELASLQGILRALRDHVNSNPFFFDELAEDRNYTLQRCLHGCFITLQELNELITKYRGLVAGDGKQMWQKIKWVTQRKRIEELKSRTMVHTANLHLYMSSIGNSSLKRLETLMLDALERDNFLGSSETIESPVEKPSAPISAISKEIAGANGANALSPAKPKTFTDVSSMPRLPRGSISSESTTSIYSDGTTSTLRTLREQDEPVKKEPVNIHVKNAVASAMQELHQIQIREQLLRPLRYEPRDNFHQPDAELIERFESSANDEEQVRRLSTRDWLRVAVWWLLKARTTLANCDKSTLVTARGSMSPSTVSSSSSHQAYVDLLKASYILYDIVLKRQSHQSLMIDENRKLISDLSEGIKDDFAQFTSVDIPDSAAVKLQNLEIWEPVQPDETLSSSSETLLGFENARYTTVEMEDAGAEDERVLLRTFVNAGIGGKKLRMRTKGAPYMLLLSIVEGESEPKVTICNQSGTFCLQRDFTHEDLAQLLQVSNASLSGVPSAKLSEPVTLKFDSITVSLSFQYSSDLGQFINIPKSYFDAVRQREPVDSDEFSETTIFKSSVEMVEQLRAPLMKSMNPPVITRSCEVRILERTFGEVWRSIRRVVISSSMAEKAPRSIEFFMPMSRVQVSRADDLRFVQVKWSDTGQERTKSDGSYNPVFSYVYDDTSPNLGFTIQFRTQQQAEEFENVILSLTYKPLFSWSQPSSSGRVYEVSDVTLDQKQYKAILLLESRLSWKYCRLYYLYRDVDYIYDSSNLRVQFPTLTYVDYISSHVDQLYRATNNVFFSHCQRKRGSMEVDFNTETVLHAFMSSLASSYELCFSRRAESMTTKKPSFFGSNRSTKGETEVQLWRKGNSMQLASRWVNHVTDRWLTMSVPIGSRHFSGDSNRVEFPETTYFRGGALNLAVITTGENAPPREGPIAIYFAKQKDREDFIATLDWRYGHSYDLLGS